MPNLKRRLVLAGIAACLLLPAMRAGAGLTLEPVASGLQFPLAATAPMGDTRRLFVAERAGIIRVIKDGTLLPMPFLDITSRVTTNGDSGLLGLAFHPRYHENGHFFVYYGRGAISTFVQRYTAQGIPAESDTANPDSGVTILPFIRDSDIHLAGSLSFSPLDGYLYISVGDGNSVSAPQSLNSHFGKILRIDVDGGNPYAIPPENPFVGLPGALPEILAYGLRNPFRGSVDRETGDYWFGDVGVVTWEEVNLVPAGTGGQNFGWANFEGPLCRLAASLCEEAAAAMTPAVHQYNHDIAPGFDAAVTGGYVYRGAAIPWMRGHYFFGDFSLGRVWTIRTGAFPPNVIERTVELDPEGTLHNNVVAFGEDGAGELYVLDFGGSIYKITVPAADFHSADRNRDGAIRLSELLRVIQMYNSSGLQCAEGTEDGYAPGGGGEDCPPHDSDYAPQDWRITLNELLRLIQVFNSPAYAPCAEGEDGICTGTL